MLVVVGDDAVRDSLTVSLETAGFRVSAFAEPDHLPAHAQSGRAGCLLVDLALCDGGVGPLIGKLSSLEVDLPVVLMTSDLRSPSQVRGLPAGIFAVLEQPFDDHQLLSIVEQALQSRRDQ